MPERQNGGYVGEESGRLLEVARVALKLGFTAFGGPAAHIAMLREEVVTRRHWLTDEHFLDLLGFVAAVNPLIPRLRRSPWTGALLDGVNVSALGLMAAVTLQLGRAAIVDWLTGLLAVLSAVALLWFKVNSAWLILAGGLIALAFRWLGA